VLVALPGASGPVVQVAAGQAHSLAVTSTGQLYAFGYNYQGQLGSATSSGTGSPNPTPALVSLPGASGPVVQVAAGQYDSLAVTSTGQLYTFGDNGFGELGSATNSGTGNPNPTPALVGLPGAASVDTIAHGPEALHSLVVLGDLAVATGALPDGTAGVPYSAQLQASGGTPPYTWSASGLPSGLSVDPSSGAISRTPTQSGTFSVEVTVTDSNGIVSSKTLQLSIAPAPTTTGNPPISPAPTTTGGPPIAPAPALTALRVSPRAFALAGRRVKGKCVEATSKNKHAPSCKRPIRFTISYTLNEADNVTFRLALNSAGREVDGKCVKATTRNHKHPRCMRTVALPGNITVAGIAGADRYMFNGKIGGHTLAPGSYRLIATPAGSAPDTTTFTIVS
jgi:hypothetical protein